MTTTPKKRALSGIKPTGTPHIGNYAGMLAPMIAFSRRTDVDTHIFIADYHCLNNAEARLNLGQLSLEVAATLLALGFDPKTCTFYRQSDVPETFELASFLTNFTPKDMMNRAHGYKAIVDKYEQEMTPEQRDQHAKMIIIDRALENKRTEAVYSPTGLLKRLVDPDITDPNDRIVKRFDDPDTGVNMGLYNYPILMSADILLFDTDIVPIGRDQRQHIEFARDIAGSVNAVYGADVCKLPQAQMQDDVMEIPGLDGRKMSKSYGNVLPIFAPADEVLKICKRIKTDSKQPDEPKERDNLVYQLYRALATPAQLTDFESRFLPGGMGYGTAKTELAALHDSCFGPARAEYQRLMGDPGYVRTVLQQGAQKARDVAAPVLARIRKAAGINI